MGCRPASERSVWGRYYDQKPRVMAGNIAQGYVQLLAQCEHEAELMNLWQRKMTYNWGRV
ncbi:MAG: thermostable hemolysin [Candidatus Thiodiazotropha sp.]